MIGFIKNADELKEGVSSNDILDKSVSINELNTKIDELMAIHCSTSILGIVGAYGVGKSTLLEQVKNKRMHGAEEWFHFDAWQFPDRSGLWDGFILETARQVGNLDYIKRILDGNNNSDKKIAVDAFSTVLNITSKRLLVPLSKFLGDAFKSFLDETPVRRIFEMQEVLKELLLKIDASNLVFVLEDVDRSGIEGLYFLETLKQFFDKNRSGKNIVFIVPVSSESYFDNVETYLKCFDFVDFFNKQSDNLESFVQNFFNEKEDGDIKKLAGFLNYIYKKYPSMTLRKIKLIIRQANLNYINLYKIGYNPNSLVCIAVQASKYIPESDNNHALTKFDYYKRSKVINKGDEIARLILSKRSGAHINDDFFDHEGNIGVTHQIHIVNTDPSNIQSLCGFKRDVFTSEVGKYSISDFYFEDL